MTGANRGIGLAITRHMSAQGWQVYAAARSDSALRELESLPGVHPTRLDITDRESVGALAAQLPAQLDGVVNNAGIIVNGPVEGLALEDLARQLDVNVTAQIGVTQTVGPHAEDGRRPEEGCRCRRSRVDSPPSQKQIPTRRRQPRPKDGGGPHPDRGQ